MAATSSDVVVDDAGNVCLDIMVRQLSLGDEPPALLLSLPADMLLHLVSLLDVVGLLKFEAAAKSASQIGGCAEWERVGPCDITAVTICTPICTACTEPVMTTLHGSDVCSIWILVPDLFCSSLIVSPPLPMTRPTRFFGHSTVALVSIKGPPQPSDLQGWSKNFSRSEGRRTR